MSQLKTAAIFIDAENLYFIQKGLGWEVDLPKLYEFFEERYYIYNAFYYTVVDPSSDGYAEKNQLLDALSPIGYTVRKKIIKIIKAGDKIVKKGNLDIEMALDMFNTKDLYQVIVLFSGDSDFDRALELLRTHGKEIIVISSRGYVSKELMNAADKYYDLQDLKLYFKKEGGEGERRGGVLRKGQRVSGHMHGGIQGEEKTLPASIKSPIGKPMMRGKEIKRVKTVKRVKGKE